MKGIVIPGGDSGIEIIPLHMIVRITKRAIIVQGSGSYFVNLSDCEIIDMEDLEAVARALKGESND